MKQFLLYLSLLAALPAMAADEPEPTYFEADGIKYQYFDGTNYWIGGYMTWTGTEMINVPKEGNVCIVAANPDYTGSELVIPETVRYNDSDVRVVGIEAKAFEGNQYITSVSFPKTFPQKREQYKIAGTTTTYKDLAGANMFAGCSKLTKVIFGDGMKTFYVPGTCTPFKDCPISELVIPESLTDLTETLVQSGVETIYIPDWVTNISFKNCSKLKEVPALLGMTEVPQYCFSYCTSLVNVTLPVNATTVGRAALSGCSNMETLVIPDKTELLGFDMARNCQSLRKVVIGSGVKEMGVQCFYNSPAITEIEFKCTAAPKMYNYGDPTRTEENAEFFSNEVFENAKVTIPASSLNSYKARKWFKFDTANVEELNVSSINGIVAEGEKTVAGYYNLNGTRVNAEALPAGVYIEVYTDGTARKRVVK